MYIFLTSFFRLTLPDTVLLRLLIVQRNTLANSSPTQDLILTGSGRMSILGLSQNGYGHQSSPVLELTCYKFDNK